MSNTKLNNVQKKISQNYVLDNLVAEKAAMVKIPNKAVSIHVVSKNYLLTFSA